MTEHRDIDSLPTLPPRWDPTSTQQVKTVYLDQWCYNALAKDRSGQPRKRDEQGCFEYFRRLALEGRVVFVLSRAHYYENGVRTEVDERWNAAVAMAELSGLNTITAVGLDEWDALVGVARFWGLETTIPKPRVFGWGWHYCLYGKDVVGPRIIETATGRPATWDHLPAEVAAELEELDRRLAGELELTWMARANPRLAPHTPPIDPLPYSDFGKRMMEREQRIAALLAACGDQYPRTPAGIRAALEAPIFLDEVMLPLLLGACFRLKVSPSAFLDRIRTDPGPDLTREQVIEECLRQGISPDVYYDRLRDQLRADPEAVKIVKRNRKSLRKLHAALPIQGRHSELRVQSHLQQDRQRLESDALDIFQIASISPFVDYMVVDAFMADLSGKAGLHKRDGAVIMRHLDDLRKQLRHDLGD